MPISIEAERRRDGGAERDSIFRENWIDSSMKSELEVAEASGVGPLHSPTASCHHHLEFGYTAYLLFYG
jgi:hypothetical protein